MLKWMVLAFASLVALVGVAALVGYFLPVRHRASRSVEISAPPPAVFAMISDMRRSPEWRSDVRSVEILSGDGSGMVFREHGRHGAITFRIEQLEPDARMITRIADSSLAFGGTWTQELRPTPGGTMLTITEDGEIYNPIFRLMSAVVFSHYASIDTYLEDLRKRLGS